MKSFYKGCGKLYAQTSIATWNLGGQLTVQGAVKTPDQTTELAADYYALTKEVG